MMTKQSTIKKFWGWLITTCFKGGNNDVMMPEALRRGLLYTYAWRHHYEIRPTTRLSRGHWNKGEIALPWLIYAALAHRLTFSIVKTKGKYAIGLLQDRLGYSHYTIASDVTSPREMWPWWSIKSYCGERKASLVTGILARKQGIRYWLSPNPPPPSQREFNDSLPNP